MFVAIAIEEPEELERALAPALRLARGSATRLVVWIGGAGKDGEELSLAAGGELAAPAETVRACLDAELGADAWAPFVAPEEEAPAEEEGPIGVTLEALERPRSAPSVGAAVTRLHPELLIAARAPGSGDAAPEALAYRRELMRGVSCELVILLAGTTEARGGILVAAARGPHCAAALKLADRFTSVEGAPAPVALYVEPDIGPDSRRVAVRILDRILSRALGSGASRWQRRVVIDDDTKRGVCEASREGSEEVVLLGATKLGALGQRLRGSLPDRVARELTEPTVGIVRAATPLRNRAQRRLEAMLQRIVPQLEREQRVSLVERVQSNSHWDFDFMTLISLSTLIAAIGLVLDSSAVIIGAMLVAPLMTPILGLGIALVQGNSRLARMALRSVTLGFLNSFVLGVLVGLLVPGFARPTAEMVARDWPGVLDLVVAFVAGAAGAYSSSRPSLLAALPGVAIAAALVPPIAAAGLAFAIGDMDLAAGASLLFLVNIVAIVLASIACLWAVGMRSQGGVGRWFQVGRLGVALLALVLGVLLAVLAPEHEPRPLVPEALRAELVRELGEGARLRAVHFEREANHRRLVVEVGRAGPPPAGVAEALREAARRALGEPVPLRVEFVWEREL